jgi:hypothetical protein
MYASAWCGDGGIRVHRFQTGPAPDVGKRGRIHGFSQASRGRLTDKLMAIPWRDLVGSDRHASRSDSVLLTLTYPECWPGDWDTWKSQLDAFRRSLSRVRDHGFAAVWRMEYQKRGAPHFHILLMFDDEVSIAAFGAWARRTWARIVGAADLEHLRHGADVRPLYAPAGDERRLMHYLIKYLGKPDDGERFGGRIWGAWYEIPQVIRAAVSFNTRQSFVEFQRRLRRWGKHSRYLRRVHNSTGLRVFCSGESVLVQLCRELDGATLFTV